MPVGSEPEARITITTLHLDTDYLIEHLFWQRLDLIPDRDAARDRAAKLNPEPVQVLRLGEREVERLEPILDELVTLTEAGQDAARYFRTHALLLTVLEAIAPHIRHAPVAVPPLTSRERAARVASPRWRAFRPIRREAAQAAALMHSDIAKRWRIEDLAAHACLSPSQFTRVFRDSFGVTPLVYLTILRVQEMARLTAHDRSVDAADMPSGGMDQLHASTCALPPLLRREPIRVPPLRATDRQPGGAGCRRRQGCQKC